MRRNILLGTVVAVVLAGCVAPQPVPSPAASRPGSSAPAPASSSAAPSSAAPVSTPSIALAQMPRIDGSTANIPLISLVIQRLTGVPQAEADNTVKTSGTPDAYRNLVNGSADLLLVYEADKSVKKEIKESGVKLELHPIGRDALVFFTNSANPVRSLTTAQYRAIYTGKVTNWAQVGGSTAKIIAYERPEESGSQALLRKYVVGSEKMAKAPVDRVTAEMDEIIEGVASYANSGNAIGYSVYYYLANMYAVDGITMMGVAGVQPSRGSIADGSYPYTNDFYAVVRADEKADSPARTVMRWLLTADGQKAVADAGYVPASR